MALSQKLVVETWKVAYREKHDGGLPQPQNPFTILKNPWWGWAADPFLFEHQGEIYLFAELYSHIKQKGCIGYCKWQKGYFSSWKKVIEESWHLSYPNIFIHAGNIYLCPESYQRNMVYCYRAVDFPTIWKKEVELMQGLPFTDTTFYEFDNTKYGFACLHNQQLLLFRFNHPTGEIEFSGSNPVISDMSSCRPAGKIIHHNNEDYRVSQDCKGEYGKGIVFSRMKMNWPDYSETEVMRWYPYDLRFTNSKGGERGVHTYNSVSCLEVIDMPYTGIILLNIIVRTIKRILRIIRLDGIKNNISK